MWVVFNKTDKKVVATSAHSALELDKATALEEALRGMGIEKDEQADFDAIQVLDPDQVPGLLGGRGRRRLMIEDAKGKLQVVAKEGGERFALSLRTNVSERHPVDDLPVIAADGESMAEITVHKVDAQDRPVARGRDTDPLWLRTDGGTLLDMKGNPIWRLDLSRGEASFQLRSEKIPRVATVRVFNANPFLRDAEIQIEFAPLEATAPAKSAAAAKAPTPIKELAIPKDFQKDLQSAVAVLREIGCEKVYLFGSLATSDVRADSDIDLAVRGRPEGKLNELRKRVTQAVGRKVDVVDLDSNTPFARHLRSIEKELLWIG